MLSPTAAALALWPQLPEALTAQLGLLGTQTMAGSPRTPPLGGTKPCLCLLDTALSLGAVSLALSFQSWKRLLVGRAELGQAQGPRPPLPWPRLARDSTRRGPQSHLVLGWGLGTELCLGDAGCRLSDCPSTALAPWPL